MEPIPYTGLDDQIKYFYFRLLNQRQYETNGCMNTADVLCEVCGIIVEKNYSTLLYSRIISVVEQEHVAEEAHQYAVLMEKLAANDGQELP